MKNPAPDGSGAGQNHKLCQYIRGWSDRSSCCYLSSTKIFGSGLTGTTVCHDVIRQRLTFAQSPHTGAFDSADVNEDVVAAVRWLDKPKALLGVKPLHCTRVHKVFLSRARRTRRAELRPVCN